MNEEEEKKIRRRIKFVEGTIKAHDASMEPINDLEEEVNFLQDLLGEKRDEFRRNLDNP